MEPTPHPLTLTVEQAAKVLGIGRSTAYELVHTGAIPSLRLGRRIVVPIAKLADQLGLDHLEVVAARPAASEGCERQVPKSLF
jgi:excisionase family DNA binding protein